MAVLKNVLNIFNYISAAHCLLGSRYCYAIKQHKRTQSDKYAQHLQLDQRSPLFIQMFVVPLASVSLPSAVASRHQPNRFSNRSIVYLALGLRGDFLSACLKRDQFL